jgi:hypothetical protein
MTWGQLTKFQLAMQLMQSTYGTSIGGCGPYVCFWTLSGHERRQHKTSARRHKADLDDVGAPAAFDPKRTFSQLVCERVLADGVMR